MFRAQRKNVADLKRRQKTDPHASDMENLPPRHPESDVIRHTRRQVAQLMTILRQRQIDQGITRRESRSMSRRAAVAKRLSEL